MHALMDHKWSPEEKSQTRSSEERFLYGSAKGSITNWPWFAQDCLIFKLKILCPGHPLGPGQTRTVDRSPHAPGGLIALGGIQTRSHYRFLSVTGKTKNATSEWDIIQA